MTRSPRQSLRYSFEMATCAPSSRRPRSLWPSHLNRRTISIALVSLAILAGCELTNEKPDTIESMPELVGKTFSEAVKAFADTPYEEKLIYEDLVEDRFIWREKNWIVMSQEPPPGQSFDSAIRPCVGVVKKDELPGLNDKPGLTCTEHLTANEKWLADNEAREADKKAKEKRDKITTTTVGVTPFEEYLLAIRFEESKDSPGIYYRQILDSEGCEEGPCWKFVAYVVGRSCPNSFYMRLAYWDKSGKTLKYANSDDQLPLPELPVIFTVYDTYHYDDSLQARYDRFFCS